ncbi:MAG: response regulator, partial [Plesiomonas sp.]
MSKGRVWVADDDSAIRWVLDKALSGSGISCETFDDAQQVLNALTTRRPDVLISDIRMPGIDGLTLLSQLHTQHPDLPVIIMTAHS